MINIINLAYIAAIVFGCEFLFFYLPKLATKVPKKYVVLAVATVLGVGFWHFAYDDKTEAWSPLLVSYFAGTSLYELIWKPIKARFVELFDKPIEDIAPDPNNVPKDAINSNAEPPTDLT